MAKRKRIPADLNQRAKAIVDFATSDERGMDEARPGTFMRDVRSRLRVGNRISIHHRSTDRMFSSVVRLGQSGS
jgi:hypothetical protein